MPFNTTYANNILNFAFGKGSLSAPSNVFMGLCSNDPEADNGTFNELSGNGYSRILISTGSGYPNLIGSASNRMIQNTKQINWTKATGDWVTACGFGLFTSETGGTPYYYGSLAEPIAVSAGSVALFDPYSLKLTFPETDIAAVATSE